MLRLIRKIFFFLSLFFLFVLFRELVSLVQWARGMHPWAGYAMMATIAGVLIWFVIWPVIQILRIPANAPPTRDPRRAKEIYKDRMERFRSNPRLRETGFDFRAVPDDENGYRHIVRILEPEAEKIRKRYVTQLFYSSSIIQNGFIDALLILSISVNLVKSLFLLYHGRVTNRDLLAVARRVYYSMAIGGSEGVEAITEELVTKLGRGGIQSIPFAARVLGSLADGFVNAALLTRISIITENYCKMVLIGSDRDLYPSYRSVTSATRIILADLLDRLVREMKEMGKERSGEWVIMALNPVGAVLGRAMGRMADRSELLSPGVRDAVRETGTIVNNPLGYTLGKLREGLRKRKK